ncbi:shikimate dehydrogenase [Microcoleus vaginatus GB1-A2]|uniref:shikimate dehydrogenase n=1 Tax=Microcoleus vaginatus TaxID=119532 RepID=UPI001686F62E|nr:shikimate dehydrogenase [Microcoleus sp. FACHB-61]
MIKGTTKLLGVIGHPVEHSLSPAMHNAAISHLGVDFVYLPFPIKPGDLKAALAGFAAIGVRGFSITIPHKQAILPLLSEVSPIARSIGAVNTVYLTDKGWCGTNTDVEGFLAPLQTPPTPPDQGGARGGSDWSQKVAVILGNGGAARAVVAGCAQLGCAEIHVVGRSEQNLAEFQQSWVNSPMPVQNLQVHTWENLSMLISQADLLVNTTPVGMYPQGEKSPVADGALNRISAGAIVYDLIYNPNPTQFLKDAQLRGARAIDGLEMLVQQGAAALKIWLHKESVPVDVMRQALRQHLGLS